MTAQEMIVQILSLPFDERKALLKNSPLPVYSPSEFLVLLAATEE